MVPGQYLEKTSVKLINIYSQAIKKKLVPGLREFLRFGHLLDGIKKKFAIMINHEIELSGPYQRKHIH